MPGHRGDAVGVGEDRSFTAGIIVGMLIAAPPCLLLGIVFAVTRRFRTDLRDNRKNYPLLRKGFWIGAWKTFKWATIGAVVLAAAVLAFVQGPDQPEVTPATSPSPTRSAGR
jgi:hypothetical protein